MRLFILKYRKKSFLPLINFPTATDLESQKIRDEIISNIRHILVRKFNLNQEYNNGIGYLLSELIENIVEHAGTQKGWIFVQYNTANQFIEIALLDSGKTIFNSFSDRGYREITSHTMAIEEAIKGLSSKDRIERGYGIPTSLKMTKRGLNGDFTLISGGGIYFNDDIFKLSTFWPGTCVIFKIKRDIGDFRYTNYIE